MKSYNSIEQREALLLLLTKDHFVFLFFPSFFHSLTALLDRSILSLARREMSQPCSLIHECTAGESAHCNCCGGLQGYIHSEHRYT